MPKKKTLFDLAKPGSTLKSSSSIDFSKNTNQKKMTDFVDEDNNVFIRDDDRDYRAPFELDVN